MRWNFDEKKRGEMVIEGMEKLPSQKRAGGSLRYEEARCGDILRIKKEREREKWGFRG